MSEKIPFHERKDRIFLRQAIEKMGGSVKGYNTSSGKPSVCVAMPREGMDHIHHLLECYGFIADDAAKFSICSDNPPDHLRHYGPYNPVSGGNPGYWYFINFVNK